MFRTLIIYFLRGPGPVVGLCLISNKRGEDFWYEYTVPCAGLKWYRKKPYFSGGVDGPHERHRKFCAADGGAGSAVRRLRVLQHLPNLEYTALKICDGVVFTGMRKRTEGQRIRDGDWNQNSAHWGCGNQLSRGTPKSGAGRFFECVCEMVW